MKHNVNKCPLCDEERLKALVAEMKQAVDADMAEYKRQSDPYKNHPNWARPIG